MSGQIGRRLPQVYRMPRVTLNKGIHHLRPRRCRKTQRMRRRWVTAGAEKNQPIGCSKWGVSMTPRMNTGL